MGKPEMLRRLLDQFQFVRADADDRTAALQLRRAVYTADLGHVPEDESDDVAEHFVAKSPNGDLIAAFMIVGPDHRPFDFERFVDLSPVVLPGRRAALIGRLCIRRDNRDAKRSTIIQLGMLKLAYDFSVGSEITDLVMFTFPHLVTFYRRHFFNEVGGTFHHVGYNRDMHVMLLDVVDFQRRQSSSGSAIARFLLSGSLSDRGA